MFKKLIPDMYQKDIFSIDYKKLKDNNIKCLLFDLDNTCVGYHEKNPTKELKKLFASLKKQGFIVVIFSNAMPKRLVPFNNLNVDLHPASRKPFKTSYIKMLKKYNLKNEEVCIIGDQLFTDILGGNKVGIRTCLVEPVTSEDFILTKIFRSIEKVIIKKFTKKKILIKGVYYE